MNDINCGCSSCLEFLGDYEVKSIEMKSGNELSGGAIMRLLIDDEEYWMRLSMKEGKKEGVSMLLRKNGTVFMKLMFVNDECEGEVTKRNENGSVVLKGRVSKGKEVGIWIEYDDDGNEKWRGLYRNGKRYSILKEEEGMKGFYSEMSVNGDLLNVSEYDDNWMKNGRCFEVKGSKYVKRECVYENGMKKRMIREFTEDGLMILFDDNGMRVYEGGFEGDMMKGFVREGRGKEFGIDGKRVLYVGEWKNGKRDGTGRELNENGTVLRKGRWIEGVYEDAIKRFEDGYGNDLSVFDIDCLKGIERVEIGSDCFTNVTLFVIDRLNELRSVIIGKNSCTLDKNSKEGSKCLIMNCDQLSEIHIGYRSFCWCESFELKNLSSLISIQLDDFSFCLCRSIVFEGMNE